jgi:hypothetical protein
MTTVTVFNGPKERLTQEFEDLFREHYPMVFRSAFSVIFNTEDAEAKLKLPDGSRVEMQPESELSWQRTDDGLRIQLKQGSVSVTPAEEAVGKL